MSDCFICKKPFGDNKVRTVKARGVKTLLERAKFKNDVDNELFLQRVSEVTVHIPCYHYYSDSRTDNVVRCLSSSSPSPSVSANLDTDFNFSNNCFICGEVFQDRSQLRQSRQRKICNVRHEDTKKSILDLVLKRSDDKAKSIADRIANVSSLVDVGARYHKDCSKQLYSKKWSEEIRHDERKNNIDNAMEDVFAYLHENSEDGQFRLMDLMKSIKGDYIPEKRTVVERLKAKYKDDIVIFNKGKQEIIICFKDFLYKVISKKSSHKKNDPQEEKLQKVRDAAAIILEDIRSQHYETNQYSPSDNSLEEVNSLIPESLSVLLSEIICQSKRKSLVAAQRKCTSIAHSIIGATRPASFISPLLLDVGSVCKCRGNCGSMCSCRKAGLKCSIVCLHCSGETCSNIMEISELMEENEFEDKLPTITPILTPVIPQTFTFDVELHSEPRPGPSKRSRIE